MIQGVKWRIATWLVILFILVGQVQLSSAGEDYLIVRIVGAEYPPTILLSDEGLYTMFTFNIFLQIENPTQSNLSSLYWCSPYPFPHLATNLQNKSLEARLSIIYEDYPLFNITIPPGIRNESYYLSLLILDYSSKQLPLGEYEIWFDFTNCSYVPVPVVKEKMFVYVSASNITYYFEYNNATQVFSPKKANYAFFLLISSLILLTIRYRKAKTIR